MNTPTTPSAEALAAEREAFEQAQERHVSEYSKGRHRPHLERTGDGYQNPLVHAAWQGWQARAALSAEPKAQAQAAEPHFMSLEAVQQRATQKEFGRIERMVGAIKAAQQDAYSEEDKHFHAWWYSHMVNDQMQPPYDRVSYSLARSIWDAALAAPEARETAEPIGFITEEALRLLRDPEWLAQRGTYANLWGTDGPPNRAIVPVFAAPVSQPEALPLKSMNWHPGPIKTEWGDGMLVADVELSPDQTLTMFIHKNALPLLKDKP